VNDEIDLRDPTTVLNGMVQVAPVVGLGCVLRVLSGPDAGAVYEIPDVTTRRVLLGQSPVCDVRLADRSVSRRHAAIETTAGSLRIVDLDSMNGTWVDRTRVKEAFLAGGATLRLGATTLRFELDTAARELPASRELGFGRMVGASPEMRSLYPTLAKLAASEVPVLIEGETGTGKEVLAEAIHEASPRRGGPFVVLDCTSVAPALIEAELFGHERGAFSGAVERRNGMFEEAQGGTLFIDEIGDLQIALQAKLLRALERKEVRRVGSNTPVQLDVRIVAATRRDLDREVQARRFRDDLFFRLAVARVELPPLRRRTGDVVVLLRWFWRIMGGDDAALAPDVIQRFEDYDWPGNIRELHNAVAQLFAMGDYDPPGRHLRGTARGSSAPPPPPLPSGAGDFLDRVVAEGKPLPRARQQVVAEFERRYLQRVLDAHGGNVSRAAAASGIGRRYFQMIRAKR
jgi:DNA-binding NtrC family response regulator